MKRIIATCLLSAALAAGCAVPTRQPVPAPAPQPAPPAQVPQEVSPAAADLAGRAREAAAAGRYEEAVQYLERGIRISSGSAVLWHELALVRFEQGRYEQARQLAARSNSLLNGDAGLKARNEALIERSARALSD